MMSTENFYASKYWQSGNGLKLWNLRKVQAFIQTISFEDTPYPFLTVGSDYMTDEWDNSWHAQWSTIDGQHSLTVEAEETSFLVYADNFEISPGWEFWFLFGGTIEDREKDIYNDWTELDDAVVCAKEWIRINQKDIRPSNLKNIFGL